VAYGNMTPEETEAARRAALLLRESVETSRANRQRLDQLEQAPQTAAFNEEWEAARHYARMAPQPFEDFMINAARQGVTSPTLAVRVLPRGSSWNFFEYFSPDVREAARNGNGDKVFDLLERGGR
jgi:hypothetical protein